MPFRVCLLAIAFTLFSVPSLACFLEAADASDPPTTARISVPPDCDVESPVRAVVVTATGEQVGSAVFEPPFEASLTLDVSKWRDTTQTAGVYRINWLTEPNGAALLDQLLTVPCPAPPSLTHQFEPDNNQLTFAFPAGDVCQGETTALLELADLAGSQVIEPQTRTLASSVASRIDFRLTDLEGDQRYKGMLTLRNESGQSTQSEFSFVTVCGEINARADILAGVLTGEVLGSSCHFPVKMALTVKTQAGEALTDSSANLTERKFQFNLPGVDRWAAGDYTVALEFTSSNGSSALIDVDQSVPCTPPVLSNATIDTVTDPNQVTLAASYLSADPCHSESEISVQLRDTNDVVVFTRKLTAQVSSQPMRIALPLDVIAGATYELNASIRYGVDFSQRTDFRQTLSTSCIAADILDFGLTSAEAEGIGGLVRVAECNMPTQAVLEVRDTDKRLVATRTYEVIKSDSGQFGVVPPTSITHLDTGDYSAKLSITDSQGRTSSRETDITLDVDGPLIDVRHRSQALDDTNVPIVSNLNQLTVTYTDTSTLLPPASAYPALPTHLDSSLASATIQEIAGEAESELLITGYLDIPRAFDNPGLVGVLFRNDQGKPLIAPITRSFTPVDSSDLRDFHPSRRRVGFRAIVRTSSLEPGQHRVSGVVIDQGGQPNLVRAQATFAVSSIVKRRPNVFLTRGVTEIPLVLTFHEEEDTISRATLSAVQAVPDGTYSLTISGQDRYGNSAQARVVVLDFQQDKDQRLINQPAISGQTFRVSHRFISSATDQPFDNPLRLSVRRISGTGQVKMNENLLDAKVYEFVSQPSFDGTHHFDFEFIDDDIDARYVVFGQLSDLRPLEMAISSYEPRFEIELAEDLDGRVLSVRYAQQSCTASAVFKSLTEVALPTDDDVVCALRISDPTASITLSDNGASIALTETSLQDSSYEIGFVHRTQGVNSFHKLRAQSLSDLETIALAPSIDFEQTTSLRDRSNGSTTRTGYFRPGFILINSQRANAVVEIDGTPIDEPLASPGLHQIPLETDVSAVGETVRVDVRTYYQETPDHHSDRVFTFVAIPPPVSVSAVSAQLVAPDPLSIHLEVSTVGATNAPSLLHDFREMYILSREDTQAKPLTAEYKSQGDGRTVVDLPELKPGKYRLQMTVVNTDPKVAEHLKPISTDMPFEILDGTPLNSSVFTFREFDEAPFVGTLSVRFDDPERIYDLDSTTWESSVDGTEYSRIRQGPSTVDFSIHQPGSRLIRARLVNRHSQVEFLTEPVKLTAYRSLDFELHGPSETFRGWPVQITADGAPAESLTWRITLPGSAKPDIRQGQTITINAEVTGTYFIEAVSNQDSANDSGSLAAQRRYKSLEVYWPRIPPSAITGPTQVELGRSSTFQANHPGIFKEQEGNRQVKRLGEWELPNGEKVPDTDWVEYTLEEMPNDDYENILYHSWLEGLKDQTLVTAIHRIRPFAYIWPEWKINAKTVDSTLPAIHRFSVVPKDWEQWFSIPGSEIQTTWKVPTFGQVIHRDDREIVFKVTNPRRFNVSATVSDSRGNVTDLALSNVSPTAKLPFQIAGRLVPERQLHTAPLRVEARAIATVIPADREITRVAYYLNGFHVGATNGEPLLVDMRTSGIHEVRMIASSGSEMVAEDTVTFEVGENLPAICNITTIGDFLVNGIAKAECEDPDGHMVEYQWYLDGKLIEPRGSRVQLSPNQIAEIEELALIGVDSAGNEVTARLRARGGPG